MKRFFAGLGWFFGLYFGLSMLMGMVMGAIYQAKTGDTSIAGGIKFGREVGAHYGGIILLFSLFFSVAGTLGRLLPGTKKPETSEKSVTQTATVTTNKAA